MQNRDDNFSAVSVIAVLVAVLAFSAFGDDRLFVRSSPDGTQTEIGLSAAPRTATRSIRFTIKQSDVERWPEPVTITLKEKATSLVWNFSIPARAAVKPHTLRAPLGTYALLIVAAHHRPINRDVLLGDQDAHLGDLTLFRYPLLTGSIRASDGSPIAGALITDRTKHSVKSDLSGAFSMAIEDQWPSFLEVAYPGLATKQIAVPKTQISLSLLPVTLVKGSTLAVDIEGLDGDCSVDLARQDAYKHVRVLKTVHASRDSSRVVFEDLEKGEYIVVVRGDGPLQKFASSVSVGNEDSAVRKIRIEPR